MPSEGARGAHLVDAGLINCMEVAELPGVVIVTELTPAGRREVGLWPFPDTAADRLMAALGQAIERAPQGPQKTRLQKIRDGFLSAGRDLIVDVAGGVLTGQTA
jgi:hypothetical protein